MPHLRITVGAGLLACGALIAAIACADRVQQAPAPVVSEAVTSHGKVDVTWETEWDDAFDRARAEGKPVLVNFYADWCVWCKHLDSITFRDAKVAGVLARQVVPLNVDIDEVERALLAEHRVDAPPMIVLLDADGRELGRIVGYMPPAGFLRTVESILEPAASERG